MNVKSPRSNCSVAECFPEKSRWRWSEQVCKEVMCKSQCQGLLYKNVPLKGG